MQIIACQTDIVWEDKPANHARVLALVERAPVRPRALVVLPEMFDTGFSMNVERVAEGPDGPSHRFVAELARKLGAYVAAGVGTLDAAGRPRNEQLVVGPDGQPVARYFKLHPFTPGGEAACYAAGDEIVTFACGGLTVAPFVCYDLRFPEAFRRAVRRGAQLFVVIANWPEARDAHWLALLRARAIENQAYVVGVNRAGRDPKFNYLGHSLIVGPGGETLAAAGSDETVLAAELEVEPLVAYRRQLPFLADMRGDLVP